MKTQIIEKIGVVMLIFNKIGFRIGNIMSNIERYVIMIKNQFIKKTIINVFEHNNKASKYLKQKLTEKKGKIDKVTVAVHLKNLCLGN